MDRKELMRCHYAAVLMDMCESRRLSGITVTDLIEEAGTARQTFYNHFSDINDLICYAAFRPMASVSDPFTNTDSTRQAYEETARHRGFFCQLSRHCGQNNFWDALTPWLKKVYCERFVGDVLSQAERRYREACIEVYCSGSAAMFRAWCASGMETPVDIVVAVLYDMSPGFVKAELSRMPARMTDYPR